MQIEQRAKLAEAIRILREIMGEAAQLPLILSANEIADMSGLRANTVALSRELYDRYLGNWIDIDDPQLLQAMARHRVMDKSQYFASMEGRGIVEVKREARGQKTRYLAFRFALKIPRQ